jgi:hypothetical protein
LAYIGLGAKWKPFKKEKEKLLLQTNILWFWETTDLPRWDKEGKMPITGEADPPAGLAPTKSGVDSIYLLGDSSWSNCSGVWYKGSESRCFDEVGASDYGNHYHVGWKNECENASRMLGIELNFEAQYRPVVNCILLAQFGCFIPGQLYKDLDGQPNVRTIGGPQAAVGVFGLGHDPVWRAAMALDYRF